MINVNQWLTTFSIVEKFRLNHHYRTNLYLLAKYLQLNQLRVKKFTIRTCDKQHP